MVSGADYDVENRWRRTAEDAPVVTPMQYLRGCVRRVEAAPRNDWMFVPALRNTVFRWRAEHSALVMGPLKKLTTATQSSANTLVQAMKNLYHHLWHGHVRTTDGRKLPIAGDTTKLVKAEGISPLEKHLARTVDLKAETMESERSPVMDAEMAEMVEVGGIWPGCDLTVMVYVTSTEKPNKRRCKHLSQ